MAAVTRGCTPFLPKREASFRLLKHLYAKNFVAYFTKFSQFHISRYRYYPPFTDEVTEVWRH